MSYCWKYLCFIPSCLGLYIERFSSVRHQGSGVVDPSVTQQASPIFKQCDVTFTPVLLGGTILNIQRFEP